MALGDYNIISLTIIHQTFDLKPNHPQKVIIHGIPVSTSRDFILEQLKLKSFKTISACHMKNTLTKQTIHCLLFLNYDDVYKLMA